MQSVYGSDEVMDEVPTNDNVLGSVVEDGVVGQGNCTGEILENPFLTGDCASIEGHLVRDCQNLRHRCV